MRIGTRGFPSSGFGYSSGRPALTASSTFEVELAGFLGRLGRIPMVVDLSRDSHPFVRPGCPSLRPDLPLGKPPRAVPVKDGPEATAAAARRVLDRREHRGTLGRKGTAEERWTPTSSGAGARGHSLREYDVPYRLLLETSSNPLETSKNLHWRDARTACSEPYDHRCVAFSKVAGDEQVSRPETFFGTEVRGLPCPPPAKT
jgi:hypothetical protein